MTQETYFESTPDGINFMAYNDDGVCQHIKLVGYSAVIRQLDSGRFDSKLSDGLRVMAELYQGKAKRWFKQSNERLELHGTIETLKEDGTTERTAVYRGAVGGISIYPATERFALANNVEGLAFEKFGADAHRKAVMIYQSMTETDPDGGNLRLSQWGRDSIALLHDGFIETLNTEGLSPSPTAH